MVHLNPQDYVVTPNIPILDEGELVAPRDDGDHVLQLTPGFLREVRDNMNRKEENTGDLCLLCVGHVKRDSGVDEESQAPVIGYAKNWKTRKRESDGKYVLTYDEWMRKECSDVPRKYPRRSADLWEKRKEIDPVAYLGATTPHRDLGLHPLSLSRDNDTVLRTQYMADEASNKGEAKIEELLTKLVGMVGDLTNAFQAFSAGGPAPAGQEPEMSPEEAEAELQKLLGGQGAPAEPEKPKEPEEKPKQMARTDGEDTAALKKELEDVRIQLARQDITTKVKDLQASGILIEDVESEVRDILALPADMRPVQLARIEKNYRKAPGASVNPAVANAQATSKVDVDAVISLARKDGTDYDSAHFKLYGTKPGSTK